jgi:hypothetical protein
MLLGATVEVRAQAPSVTPDAQATNPSHDTPTTLSFSVHNFGPEATFSIDVACTGAAIASACNVTWNGFPVTQTISINTNQTATINVSFTTGANFTTGRVRLTAGNLTTFPVPIDSGWYDITVGPPPAAGVSVTPDIAAPGTQPPLTAGPVAFHVTNTGNVTDTFVITPRCSGELSQWCSLSVTSVSMGPGSTVDVTLTYGTADRGSGGHIALMATSSYDPAVKDSGYFDFTVPPVIISMTPDGSKLTGIPANTAGQSAAFSTVVDPSGTLLFTSTCMGAAIAAGCDLVNYPLSGGTTPVSLGVPFTSGPPGSTGRITLQARHQNDANLKDIGWIDVVVGSAPATGVAVAPDGETQATAVSGAPLVVPFVVSNTGSTSATFNLSAACTGVGLTGGCSPSSSSVTLAPNAWQAVTVQTTGGRAAGTGRVRLLATHSTVPTTSDSGWANVATLQPVTVTAAPHAGTANVLAQSTTQELTFQLTNAGGVAQLVEVRPRCTGEAFAEICTFAGTTTGAQLTVSGGTTTTARIQFATGAAGKTGRVRAIVASVSNPGLIDTAWVDITTVAGAQAAVSVTRDGAAQNTVPGAPTTISFTVQNTGTAAGLFNYAPSCSGSAVASSCTASVASASLGLGQSQTVTVSYTGGAASTTGRVALIATLSTNGAVKDSGWINVSTGPSGTTSVVVTPTNGGAASTPNRPMATPFLIQNVGTSGGTFDLTATCSGAAIVSSCTPTATSVALGAGESREIGVSYTTGASNGLSATIRLLAVLSTSSAVRDSGLVTLALGTPTVLATPDGAARTVTKDIQTFVNFTLNHLGLQRESYQVALTCTGAALASNCSTPTPIVTLDPSATATIPVWFTPTGAATTGRIRFVAQLLTNPGVNDTAWYDITSQSAPVVAVTPHDSSVSRPATTQNQQETFVVRNLGSDSATFAFTPTCTWSGVPQGACLAAPTSFNISAGGTKQVTVTYNVGAQATSGVVWLRAATQSGGVPFAADSGKITVSAPPTFPTVVLVEPIPGTSIARNQCLTIALPGDAASECGDLRLAHALPPMRTMNTTRVPTLIY